VACRTWLRRSPKPEHFLRVFDQRWHGGWRAIIEQESIRAVRERGTGGRGSERRTSKQVAMRREAAYVVRLHTVPCNKVRRRPASYILLLQQLMYTDEVAQTGTRKEVGNFCGAAKSVKHQNTSSISSTQLSLKITILNNAAVGRVASSSHFWSFYAVSEANRKTSTVAPSAYFTEPLHPPPPSRFHAFLKSAKLDSIPGHLTLMVPFECLDLMNPAFLLRVLSSYGTSSNTNHNY